MGFQQTLDRVPHQRLTASVGGPHTEWETGVGLIKHWVAGNQENVPRGRGKVIEHCMGQQQTPSFYVILKHLKGNHSVYSRSIEPLGKKWNGGMICKSTF